MILMEDETLTTMLQDTFTESNYRLFFGLAIDVLVRPWEKFVTALKYTEVRPSCISTRGIEKIHLVLARCNPFRSGLASRHDLSVVANDLWRHTREVPAAAADLYVVES